VRRRVRARVGEGINKNMNESTSRLMSESRSMGIRTLLSKSCRRLHRLLVADVLNISSVEDLETAISGYHMPLGLLSPS
jgi:hypothetical protein